MFSRKEQHELPSGAHTCPLCKNSTTKRLYVHTDNLPLMRCPSCRLIFFPVLESTAKQPRDYWTTGGSSHNVDVYTDPAVAHEIQRFYSKLLSQIEAFCGIGKLLDYGCGIGSFIRLASARGWKTCGIDTSRSAISYARNRGLPVWLLDEWKSSGRASMQSVDVVTMWDVIEHTTDPVEVLQFVSSLLEDEGLLILTTPLASFALRRVALGITRLFRQRVNLARFFFYPDHRCYFTKDTITLLLHKAGFQPICFESATTSTAKVLRKLQYVHQASHALRLLARATLWVTRIVGGNKVLVWVRKIPSSSMK